MKKILLISVCLFAVFVPNISFSQNELSKKEKASIINSSILQGFDLARELRDNRDKLGNIVLDLVNIRGSKQFSHIYAILQSISAIETILDYESEFLAIMGFIETERIADYCNYRINSLINKKKVIKTEIDLIRVHYGVIKNNAALHIVDKAKELIHSSLGLLDKSIKILKSMNEINK